MTITVVVLEALIIAATGVEAWAREKRWPLRWLAWHLAPLWLVCIVGCRALQRGAEAAARHGVERNRRRPREIVVIEPVEATALVQ